MPEQTEHRTPLNLEAVRKVLAHPLENRPWREIVRSLVEEVERLRRNEVELQRDAALWSWRAGLARGALIRIVAEVPTGPARGRLAQMVADVDRDLFPPSNEEEGGTDG